MQRVIGRQQASLTAVCVALIIGSLSPASAQSDSSIRLIGESALPTGDGLASKFESDRGVASHAAVIFADDFESGDLGAKWDDISNRGNALSFVNESSFPTAQLSNVLGTRSLKVTATLGKNTGGGFTKWFESADRLFIRFYTKFDEDCDYVHHFCTLRANKSLQGKDRWSGFGGAGLLPDGNERFSTAIEPWGNWGEWSPPGRWNFYSYWHAMKASPDGKCWGNGFRPDTQPNIQRGTWSCVEFMIQHNTPGENDGEQAYWIDGKLRGHWTGFNWRTSPTLLANAFTLESYVTDRWTKQSENVVYFDNVVIAKSYIGPSGAAQAASEGDLKPFLGEPKLEQQQVFSGDRFPTVVVAKDGSVLAVWNGVKVRRSEDGGATWPLKRLVTEGAFAYSSLNVGRPGTKSEGWIYLLSEGSGGDMWRFNLSWLLAGEKTRNGEVPKWVGEIRADKPVADAQPVTSATGHQENES